MCSCRTRIYLKKYRFHFDPFNITVIFTTDQGSVHIQLCNGLSSFPSIASRKNSQPSLYYRCPPGPKWTIITSTHFFDGGKKWHIHQICSSPRITNIERNIKLMIITKCIFLRYIWQFHGSAGKRMWKARHHNTRVDSATQWRIWGEKWNMTRAAKSGLADKTSLH